MINQNNTEKEHANVYWTNEWKTRGMKRVDISVMMLLLNEVWLWIQVLIMNLYLHAHWKTQILPCPRLWLVAYAPILGIWTLDLASILALSLLACLLLRPRSTLGSRFSPQPRSTSSNSHLSQKSPTTFCVLHAARTAPKSKRSSTL